jgi:23S rRNA pseudouridine2605 synthase
VERLRRVAVGPVRLGEMPAGAVRPLTRQEVAALEKAAGSQTTPVGVSRSGEGHE